MFSKQIHKNCFILKVCQNKSVKKLLVLFLKTKTKIKIRNSMKRFKLS